MFSSPRAFFFLPVLLLNIQCIFYIDISTSTYFVFKFLPLDLPRIDNNFLTFSFMIHELNYIKAISLKQQISMDVKSICNVLRRER